MSTKSEKLNAAMEKQEQAQAGLEKARKRVRGLVAAEQVRADPACMEVEKKIKALKTRQHRQRLLISRKRFSLRKKQEKIQQIERELAPIIKAEVAAGEELAALEKQLDAAQQKVADDVKFAGIDYGDTNRGFADFHATRKTLSTMMAAAGMGQRSRQAHMRHRDPRLTANT